jgi:hypothetical protein
LKIDRNNATAPGAVNIYDWYNLGEYVATSSQFNFNEIVYQKMDDLSSGGTGKSDCGTEEFESESNPTQSSNGKYWNLELRRRMRA